jgi:hypothetical protein
MSENDVGVVLAHGAWADGSSWSKVIAGLRSEAVKAVAAPLPLTSLPDDVAALDQMLERVEGPVVVFYRAEPDSQAPVLEPDRHDLIWLPEEAFTGAFAQHASTLEQEAAGRHPAAARGGLHRRTGAASGLEGPAQLVPHGRG